MSAESLLQQFINAATDVEQILPILKNLSLSDIKNFAIQNLKKIDSTEQKEIYSKALPITQIFPDDLIQHILSFNKFGATRFINKTFKSLTDKNESKYYKKLYQSLNINKHNETTTIIVCQHRNTLYPFQEKAGYKGPCNTIAQALELCDNDTRIIIHSGVYEFYDEVDITENIQIIGLNDRNDGDNPRICFDTPIYLCGDNFIMENITFASNSEDTAIFVDKGTFQASRCCFQELVSTGPNKYICVMQEANLKIQSCVFENGEEGVGIHPMAGIVEIHNCEFNNIFFVNYRSGCVMIHGEVIEYGNSPSWVNVTCTGNVFYEIGENYPFVEQTNNDKPYSKYGKKFYTLKNNSVTGEYSIVKKDANKLYCVPFNLNN